jgi:hypothetical protein
MYEYEYINHVLAAYLSADLGIPQDETMPSLKEDISRSAVFFEGLRSELEQAFEDKNFSWKEIFDEYNVISTTNEKEARSHAKKLLWDFLYADRGSPGNESQ